MASDTDIANLAISHLGVGLEIGNLETDKTEEAAAIRRFFALAREETLRDFPWPFATKFLALALVADNPSEVDGEWAHAYRYPTDCLLVRRIFSGRYPDTDQSKVPYRLGQDAQGILIYTDEASARAEYTIRETNPERFPADFVSAFSLRLAAYAAPRLTKGDPFKLGARALNLYLDEIGVARANAWNEEFRHRKVESEFIRVREGDTLRDRFERDVL